MDIDNDTKVLLQYISELKEHKSLISSDDPKGFDEFCLNIENQIDKFCASDGDLFMVARTLHRDITNLSSILFDVQNNKENKMLP